MDNGHLKEVSYIAQKKTPAASASRIDEDVIQFAGAFAEDIQYLIKLRGEEIQRCPGAARETTRMNDEGRSDKSPTKKKEGATDQERI